MVIVFAVIGLILGGLVADMGGALGGAALGYVIGLHLVYKRRLEVLEADLEQRARDRLSSGDLPAPAFERDWQRPAPEPAGVADVPPPVDAPRPLFPEAEWQSPAIAAAGATEAERPPPAEPALITWVRDYFTGGNIVVRSGIIVLFFGVAFLLKFAADRNMLPIEFRLAGVALGGVALLVIGWRLRTRLRAYGLALQGGGVGLLYLTAFAALRLYQLLPPTLAFALMVVVAALSAFLAIGQNSMALAALGATGGFLAPVLASTGQGNHVVLFSLYALLDAGIVAIAWFKAWRPLNLLAFVFTYGIGTAWGVLRYSPENFSSTEPFVLLFFVMFVGVAVLFALRRARDPDDNPLKDYVDGTLVFGTPVMTMLLQSALVRDRPYAMAFSALGLGAVYLALAAGAWRFRREQLRMLAAAFLALCVAFATLAVPLALDGHWTAATWALEGAAILWIGLRQDRRLAVASGVLLQLGAAVSYLGRYDVEPVRLPLANSEFLGAALIAIAAIASARVLFTHRVKDPWRWTLAAPIYWGLLWWFVAGIGEIDRFLPAHQWWPAVLGFSTLTALACAALARWDDWREFQPPSLLLLPAMFVCAAGSLRAGHFLADGGIIAWPLALAAWAWLLRQRGPAGDAAVERVIHVASLWLVVALASIELAWQVKSVRLGAPAWHYAMWALPAALALFLVRNRRHRWPVSACPDAWLGIGAAGLAVYLWSWTLAANAGDAGAGPLPYLPIVNPLELAQGLALAAVAGWVWFLHRDAPSHWRISDFLPSAWPAWVFAVFAVLTTLLLRFIHHYVGVDYQPKALMRSTVVQSTLSICWGLFALSAMVAGTRLGRRYVWFAGAALLGIVLVKMFLVDLSRNGTIARIVSFIGVGVLMLIIGRFSPVPPATRDDADAPRRAGAQEAA